MGFYWTGTGFEEREVPLPAPLASSVAPEPLQPSVSEDAYGELSPRSTGGKMLRGTQNEVRQKMAKALGNRFPLTPEAKNTETRKRTNALEQYDPLLGTWTRAQEASCESSNAAAPASSSPVPLRAANPVDRPQKEAGRGIDSIFNWSSWVRSELRERRVLVTPPPVPSSESELQPKATCEDTPEAHSSVAAQGQLAPSPQIAPVDEHISKPLSLSTATPDVFPSDTQRSNLDDNIFLPAPPSASHKELEGTMGSSATDAQVVISELPSSDGESVQDRERSRWFVLNSVLGGAPPPEASVEPVESVPVLEVFSLAGGVGKTSLVATLSRALSALGERVLLVEGAPSGSLQYFFGACDSRPGVLRTFRPPASISEVPIRLIGVDPEKNSPDGVQDSLASHIEAWARGANRVVVDVSTRCTTTARALARLSPLVLVPLVPDLSSVLTTNSIDSFFVRHASGPAGAPQVYFLLNQFDSSLPLHLEMRRVLQDRLGKRLLPFVLQSTQAVSEALAEGMTVLDYAPESALAANFTDLAVWLEQVLAPTGLGSHGRWSER